MGRFSKKYSNIKFNEIPSSGVKVVPCGPWDRRTDMTKLIDALRNFANAPKNESQLDMEVTAYTN